MESGAHWQNIFDNVFLCKNILPKHNKSVHPQPYSIVKDASWTLNPRAFGPDTQTRGWASNSVIEDSSIFISEEKTRVTANTDFTIQVSSSSLPSNIPLTHPLTQLLLTLRDEFPLACQAHKCRWRFTSNLTACTRRLSPQANTCNGPLHSRPSNSLQRDEMTRSNRRTPTCVISYIRIEKNVASSLCNKGGEFSPPLESTDSRCVSRIFKLLSYLEISLQPLPSRPLDLWPLRCNSPFSAILLDKCRRAGAPNILLSLPLPKENELQMCALRPTDTMLTIVLVLLVVVVAFFLSSKFNRQQPKSFVGKTVIVTGASSGMGKELALRYARLGSKVVLAARRKEMLDAVVQQCIRAGAEAIGIIADVSKEADCKKMVEESVKKFGSIDLLINNAGRSSLMPIQYSKPDDLEFMKTLMEVNYYGCVYPTLHALPHLRAAKGSVAVVSSLSGKFCTTGRAYYGATKSAVNTWFGCLRVEEPDISVTIINPGFVSTELNQHSFTPKGMKRFMEESDKMPASVAAELMEGYIARGSIEENMTAVGKVGAFLVWAAPGLLDVLVRKQAEKTSKLVPE
ncbi:short-chain dehydrogenase/reductase [Planoprotostelium fungivorum]|uniref:Short-chain dehydrogenase/reductase n=1 Tax=Planoprotostelium fungivorum TaxID=1890364 RepID=A0A2P6MYD3_9EUKA|nr:short-chain dehydrogenase/reductase [Planoprotostelium fungivorum]